MPGTAFGEPSTPLSCAVDMLSTTKPLITYPAGMPRKVPPTGKGRVRGGARGELLTLLYLENETHFVLGCTLWGMTSASKSRTWRVLLQKTGFLLRHGHKSGAFS